MATKAIIQGRTGSSRLPGKVLEEIAGRPVIAHVVRRVQEASRVQQTILATTESSEDDELAAAFESEVPTVRGSEPDVLDRYHDAARTVDADPIVRITGDCPLLDPDVIDRVIEAFQGSRCDYATNTLPPTYPDGLDIEVIAFETLEAAWKEAQDPTHREHVTPFIRENPDRFDLLNVEYPEDLSHHRWTVDEPEDLAFVRRLAERHGGLPTGIEETLEVLEANPELRAINQGIDRNEGYDAKTAGTVDERTDRG